MKPIIYINRETGQKEQEKVFGDRALKFLYGDDLLTKILSAPLLHLFSRYSFPSAFYGWWQKRSWTKRKVKPFIKNFSVDPSEFATTSFSSFNDFFIRKLKPEARPITPGNTRAIIPADGRYGFYQTGAETFKIKGQDFDLAKFLQDDALAARYKGGAMVIGRLCPNDYHRVHFPCAGTPQETKLINGLLKAVNPIAFIRNPHIFTENRRCVTKVSTEDFGQILYFEIGATCVGSIHQTFTPHKRHEKGAEKGYFSFGGSAIVILFEPGRITLDQDLTEATSQGFEMRCLLGQSLGRAE